MKKFNTIFLECSIKLEYLNLDHNDIKFFGQKGEYGCTWQNKLKVLSLKSNKLEYFNANMLKCAKSLKLTCVFFQQSAEMNTTRMTPFDGRRFADNYNTFEMCQLFRRGDDSLQPP